MTKLPRDISRKIDSKNLIIDRKFKHTLKQELLAMEGSEMAKKSTKKMDGVLKLFKYNFASVALVMVALVLVGGASAIVSSNRAKEASLRETAIPENLDEVLSADAIRNIALQDFPEGTLTGIEIEQEDEGLVYKVKFSDGSVRLYNALTGEPLASSMTSSSSDDTPPADLSTTITLQQARDIAQQSRPGKIIKKIEMETEHGVLVYSVRFTDDGRVDVNAQTGEIVRTEGASGSGSSSSSNDDDSSSSSGSGSSSGSTNSGSGSHDDSDDDHDSDHDDDDNSGSGSNKSGSHDDSDDDKDDDSDDN